jgi:hypothetical protein
MEKGKKTSASVMVGREINAFSHLENAFIKSAALK